MNKKIIIVAVLCICISASAGAGYAFRCDLGFEDCSDNTVVTTTPVTPAATTGTTPATTGTTPATTGTTPATTGTTPATTGTTPATTGTTPATTVVPSGTFYSKIYGTYDKDVCDSSDTEMVEDIRVGGGGEDIRICAVPNSSADNTIINLQSAEDSCPEGFETSIVGSSGSTELDLRKGSGGATIRLCYKKSGTGSPGAANMKFVKLGKGSSDRSVPCEEAGYSRLVDDGKNITDGTGSGVSYFNVCGQIS